MEPPDVGVIKFSSKNKLNGCNHLWADGDRCCAQIKSQKIEWGSVIQEVQMVETGKN